MSYEFVDSFDHYATADLGLKYEGVFNDSGLTNPYIITASAARTGIAGFRFQAPQNSSLDNPKEAILKILKNTVPTIIIGFAMRPVQYSLDVGDYHNAFLSFMNANARQVSLHLLSGGNIKAINGSNTLLGTTSKALQIGVFRYVEIKVTAGLNGSVEIRFDGQPVLNLTSVQTKASGQADLISAIANGPMSGTILGFGENTSPRQFAWWEMDDLQIINTSGAINNNFVGDHAIKAGAPTSNDTPLNWLRGGTDSGQNFSQVDEIPPNGDADFNFSSTVGNIDHYGFPASSASVIGAAAITMTARKTDGTPRSIRASVKSGAVTADSGNDLALSTNYFMYQGIFENDPNTGNPWIITNWNAAKKGIKLTV